MQNAREPELAQALRAEAQVLEALGGLLEEEHAALERADLEALARITAEKGRALTRLEETASARDAALVRAGLAPGARGLAALGPTYPPAAALQAAARAVRESNARNGARIAAAHAHVARAIVLLAQLSSAQPALYDAAGRPAEPPSRGETRGSA